jgi:putative phage-type endonuclease
MMDTSQLVQGSPEWLAARVGSLGSSRVADATARTRNGWGASRDNLMAELLVERLTGQPAPQYVNAAMLWGSETEPLARAAYEFERNIDVETVGLIRHPKIASTHASPDGYVGTEGLVEFKCPNTATHIATLLGEPIAVSYIKQMQWQMACTDRKWCDWVSFDPRVPIRMQLYITRIERDVAMIEELDVEIILFLKGIDAKEAALRAKYATADAEAA